MHGVLALPVLGLVLIFYLFYCYCLKLICEKSGAEAGVLIWIPLLQLLVLLEAADMSALWFLAFFIPLLNIVAGLVLWVKLCEARGKSALLVLLLFVPVVDLFFIPYLAFSA